MLEGLGELRFPLSCALDHKEQNRNYVITFDAYMMEFLFTEELGRGLRPTAHIGYHSNSGPFNNSKMMSFYFLQIKFFAN